jgi:hypothetical protein
MQTVSVAPKWIKRNKSASGDKLKCLLLYSVDTAVFKIATAVTKRLRQSYSFRLFFFFSNNLGRSSTSPAEKLKLR